MLEVPPLQPRVVGPYPIRGAWFPSHLPLEGTSHIWSFWAITSGPRYLGYNTLTSLQGAKQKMARQANQDQTIQAGRSVLLFNSRVHLFGHGKLHSMLEGHYLVLHVANLGTVTL
jgi:hypothetical protein